MKIHSFTIPVCIIIAIIGGLTMADFFIFPSVEVNLKELPSGKGYPIQKVGFMVDGMRCVDTAKSVASTLEGLDGIYRYVAFASRNRVEISFDPTKSNTAAIIEAIEGPVFDAQTQMILFGQFHVIEASP